MFVVEAGVRIEALDGRVADHLAIDERSELSIQDRCRPVGVAPPCGLGRADDLDAVAVFDLVAVPVLAQDRFD